MAVGLRERARSSAPHDGTAQGLDAPRQFAARASLGGTRALVGGLLVAVAAVGFFAAYADLEAGPSTSFVVARRDLPAGARLGPGDLGTEAMDLPAAVAGRSFTDTAVLDGATLVAPLAAGELVQSSSVVAKPSGAASRELTFAVAGVALASTVEAGERIDVLATYGSGEGAFTEVVAADVVVVAMATLDGRLGEPGSRSLTLALDDPAQALAVSHALQAARVTILRATGAEPLGPVTRYGQPATGGAG